MNKQELVNRLPHAAPFIFIEKVLTIDKGQRIKALKTVTAGEEVIGTSGSFPFVLLVEAMAQASGLILEAEEIEMAFLTMINDAHHIKPAVAGDVLIIESELTKKFPPLYVFRARVSVEGEVISSAEITLTSVNKDIIKRY
ncbi:MAG: 3-hydroxyacyl-[acyl-carrier-protein] dehydratase FabZ [Nitrospirae bacterium]|nr:3-hydroxyacyl-[acyl-carrier-protein] dehydratase FabZ [Nitrospirota bacterium]